MIEDRLYLLFSCACGLTFCSQPVPPSSRWRQIAESGRGREDNFLSSWHDWRYQQFFKCGLSPGRLLDVGCGDGTFLLRASLIGFAVRGVDNDDRVVPGWDGVMRADVFEFFAVSPPASYDVVTMFDVLEHMPNPDLLLREVKRVLNIGGHIAITLPNARRPLPWGREEHDYPPHHFTRWTPEALRGFLERRGFTIIRQEFGHLRLRYLSDHFFYFVLVPAMKLLMPKKRSRVQSNGSGPTVAGHNSMAEFARAAFELASAPFAWLARWWIDPGRTGRGDQIFMLARLEGRRYTGNASQDHTTTRHASDSVSSARMAHEADGDGVAL